MTAEQRATFDRDGYLIIRSALRPDEAADAREAIDRVYACVAKAGSLGEPGDAAFFDRRIWHARSRNYSEHTRKAVFFGYTYRWTAIRD